MEYLKCLFFGLAAAVVSLAVLAFCIMLVAVVCGGFEWMLTLYGAEIRFPPDVNLDTVIMPVALVMWALVCLPLLGYLVQESIFRDHSQRTV